MEKDMSSVSNFMYANVSVFEESATIMEATYDISERGIDYIFLADEGGEPTGFVFDMQIAAAMAKGVSPKAPLSQIADRRMILASTKTPALEVLGEMIAKKIPVSFVKDESGKLTGGFCFMNAIVACAVHSVCPEQVSNSASPVSSFIKTDFPVIEPDKSLKDAASEIAKKMFSCLLYVDKNKRLLGALTEKDIVKAIAFGENLDEAKVSDYLRKDFDSVKENLPVIEAVKTLNSVYAKKFVRHLAVVSGEGKVLGVANPMTFFLK